MPNIFAGVDFERPTDAVEYICTSRLARAKGLYADEPALATAVQKVLDVVGNIMPAEAWYAADAARGACPASLAGQQIGELKVEYPTTAIPKQRRYAAHASLFKLPGAARCAAGHGLYYDLDLVGSELYALQHACKLCGIDCDNLDEHLANREQQLASLGRSHCEPKHDEPARRVFAKAYVNTIVHGGALMPTTGNAVDKLFGEYGVKPNERAPLWLKNLAAEIKEIGPELVTHARHRETMDALRAHKPDKAQRWASALHYVLAPYECARLGFERSQPALSRSAPASHLASALGSRSGTR